MKNDVKSWKEDKETCIFPTQQIFSLTANDDLKPIHILAGIHFYLSLKICKYKL